MAFELSRIDRLNRTYDLASRFPGLDGPFTAADVALLPPRSNPNGATLWEAAGVTAGVASVLFAGPDADSSGAVVVTGSADLWIRVTDGPEVDSVKVERITLLGSGTVIAPGPLPQVLSVQSRTGAVVLDAADVGAATPADLTAGLATKVNSSTYTAGLAGKQDVATLAAATAAHVDDGSALDVALRAAFGSARGALTPHLRPHRQRISWVSTFQPGHGATNGTAGTTLTDDTTNPAFGTQSLKVTVPAGLRARPRLYGRPPVNATGKQLIAWAESADLSKVQLIEAWVGTGGNLSAYYNMATWSGPASVRPGTNGRWTPLRFDLVHDRVGEAGPPDITAITDYQLGITAIAGADAEVRIGGIGWVDNVPSVFPRAAVTFTFDDARSSVPLAAQVLDKYGYPAVTYVIAEFVGQSAFMTLDQLLELQERHGWELAGHTFSGALHDNRLDSVPIAEVDADMRQLKQWLIEHGSTSEAMCYPGGVFNDEIAEVVGRYFNTARTTSGRPTYNLPAYLDPLRLTCRSLASSTVQATLDAITTARARGLWVILYMHTIGGADGLSAAELDQVAAHCQTQGVEVLTIQQVMERMAGRIPTA